MSEEQPDDREPSSERQAELRAAYDANIAAGKAPYAGVAMRTRGELTWVMQERRWSDKFELPEGYERANLSGAHLASANLRGANFWEANLSGANLLAANLRGATLLYANLSMADLAWTTLSGAYLERATLSRATLRGANLSEASLVAATLSGAVLSFANLSGVNLRGANLSGAALEGTNLSGAYLEGANLSGATLNSARMDATTVLLNARLDSRTLLADVVWNGVPLTRLNWQDVTVLGEENVARQSKDKEGKRKDKATRLSEDADAVLANRQVATVLRSQGLNEHADRFAYRAQLCQLRVLRLERHYLRYLGSLLLGLISGYGYRPLRSFATYLLVVTVFALAYWAMGVQTGHTLTWNEAGIVSLTAFHGRGFFATAFQPGDPQAAVAAIEAVIGLLIEITFIATFTNRFFAR